MTLKMLILTVSLYATTLASPTGEKWAKLSRQKRFIADLGCSTVIGCLGLAVGIFPIRFYVDFFKLYYRHVDGNTCEIKPICTWCS